MKKGITGSTLKLIAVVTMLIDHIGAVIVERAMMTRVGTGLVSYNEKLYVLDLVLRSIGRIAFPIFCFLLVEGFLHTRNKGKYALRLTIFALLSEIPFNLSMRGVIIEENFAGAYQNVLFTMLIGFLTITGIEYIWNMDFLRKEIDKEKKNYHWKKDSLEIIIKLLLIVILIFAGIIQAEFLNTDYSGKGIIAIVVLYLFRRNRMNQVAAGALAFSWEFPAPLGFLPVLAYNGEKGLDLKYFFYIFYPLHLLILFFVAHHFGLV